MGSPLEDDSFSKDEDGGVKVSINLGGGVCFHSVLGTDCPMGLAPHQDYTRLNVCSNNRLLPYD